jgi:MarR family 2-MHQ and catechol resistance regulon transcriptional repressor
MLSVGDALAHRALEALVRAESNVRRVLAAELERHGLSAAGFSALVVLTTAGGELEMRTLRRRLGWTKASTSEIASTLQARGFITRRRHASDRRAVILRITAEGVELVEQLFPEHTQRVAQTFAALDDAEKRSLAEICRKLAA